MGVLLTKIVATLVLPPGGNLILGVMGLALLRRAKALAVSLLIVSFATLYLFSIAKVSDALFEAVESYPGRLPGAALADDVGAIVVLAGGRNPNAPEYGGETVSFPSLERLRYAVRLHRETGLPLLASGGRVRGEEPTSEAALMRDVIENELGVPVRWIEERSRNTAENASYTAEILRGDDIGSVILVTHAAHMPRAVESFEAEGIVVYAAPTGRRTWHRGDDSELDWLPSSGALDRSRIALHEMLGRVWYRIRY